MGKLDDTPWLHITSQFREHGMAYVTGTRHGLLELRAAIDAALNGDGQADGSVFATDGEGYQVRIRLSNTVAGCGKPVYFEAIARQAYHVERQFYESITRDRRTPIHKDQSHD